MTPTPLTLGVAEPSVYVLPVTCPQCGGPVEHQAASTGEADHG